MAAVVVFFGGYLLGGEQRGVASGPTSANPRASVHQHKHGTIDVSGDAAAPSVDLVVHQDSMSGRNLAIVTENFRFAPEHASSEHVPGEGHAHLYIDGKAEHHAEQGAELLSLDRLGLTRVFPVATRIPALLGAPLPKGISTFLTAYSYRIILNNHCSHLRLRLT